MKKITWYVNRLKAMNVGEIAWRLQQKSIQNQERKNICRENKPVYDFPLSKEIQKLIPQVDRISINWNNTEYSIFKELDIFSKYSYQEYKKEWNAGFQTENVWPADQCSYDINISQREDIGDIRTNWELNRHYQFAALAKSFYVTGDTNILKELEDLFYDWNHKNHFLLGVEWTSAMEIAIRVNSWIYTYCFLSKAFEKYDIENNKILKELFHGILTMTDYIVAHRARYSSANNHLIVEMYAVGMTGVFFNYMPWLNLAINILTDELPRQNYLDGVNKEMSLHYQSFVMEAYGLLALELKYNELEVPERWIEYLSSMSEFLRDCCGDYGETVVFGDNDEGKILDLSGRHFDHYRYVLELMGIILPKRYSELNLCYENLQWIIQTDYIKKAIEKECYYSPRVKTYKKGGYTLINLKDKKLIMGIDHAELGFDSIAAHGHADALSFQMFIDGKAVFVDPGTYNYHVPKKTRDDFRATRNHNTVCIEDENQAEILGPFLWGKRYECKEVKVKESKEEIYFEAAIQNDGNIHKREIRISDTDTIKIEICDEIKLAHNVKKVEQNFILGPEYQQIEDTCVKIENRILNIKSTAQIEKEGTFCSVGYNHISDTTKLKCSVSQISNSEVTMVTTITIREENENFKSEKIK